MMGTCLRPYISFLPPPYTRLYTKGCDIPEYNFFMEIHCQRNMRQEFNVKATQQSGVNVFLACQTTPPPQVHSTPP